jgi:outer membrane protein assembly factor BamB
MRKSIHHRTLCIISAAMLLSSSVYGKIADCPAISKNGTEYSSHGNYVQAINQSTGQVLWRTELFPPEVYTKAFNPTIEEVQQNISCIREVQAKEVVVSDKRGRIFRVNRTNGKLLSTKNPSES